MTDTGQIPGEGLPENAGGAPEGPQPAASGTHTTTSPQQDLSGDAAGGVGGDEDLLLPGSWGAGAVQPAPVNGAQQAEFASEQYASVATEYAPPAAPEYPAPGPHEIDGRDSGHLDYGAVRLPEQSSGEGHSADAYGEAGVDVAQGEGAEAQGAPADDTGAQGATSPAAASSGTPSAGAEGAPSSTPSTSATSNRRRPLHLGPPVPEQSGTVRTLADRGPAPTRAARHGEQGTPVGQSVPQQGAAPQQGPPTLGPEYLDVGEVAGVDGAGFASGAAEGADGAEAAGAVEPAEGAARFDGAAEQTLPGPQLGALPPQLVPWEQQAASSPEAYEGSAVTHARDGLNGTAYGSGTAYAEGAAYAEGDARPTDGSLNGATYHPADHAAFDGTGETPAPGEGVAQAGGPLPDEQPVFASQAAAPEQGAWQEPQPADEGAPQAEGVAGAQPWAAEQLPAERGESPLSHTGTSGAPQPPEADAVAGFATDTAGVPVAGATEAPGSGATEAQAGAAVLQESAAPGEPHGASSGQPDGVAMTARIQQAAEQGHSTPQTAPEQATEPTVAEQPPGARPPTEATALPDEAPADATAPGAEDAVPAPAEDPATPADGTGVAGSVPADPAEDSGPAPPEGPATPADGTGVPGTAPRNGGEADGTAPAEATAPPATGTSTASFLATATEVTALDATEASQATGSAATEAPAPAEVHPAPWEPAQAGAETGELSGAAPAEHGATGGQPAPSAVTEPHEEPAPEAVHPVDGTSPSAAPTTEPALTEPPSTEPPSPNSTTAEATPVDPTEAGTVEPDAAAAETAEAGPVEGVTPEADSVEPSAAAPGALAPEAAAPGAPHASTTAPTAHTPGPVTVEAGTAALGTAEPGALDPVTEAQPASGEQGVASVSAPEAQESSVNGVPEPQAPHSPVTPEAETSLPEQAAAPEMPINPINQDGAAGVVPSPAGQPAPAGPQLPGAAPAEGAQPAGEQPAAQPPASVQPSGGEAPEQTEAAQEPGPGAQSAEQIAAAAPVGEPAPGYDEAEREAVHRLMRERRDIRNGFRSDPIPDDVLLRVLEAAHTAPSVGHSQPWDFVVIRSAETRRAMHELAERQREVYAESLPKGRAKQFKELKIEAIVDTPVNIVVTADPTRGGRHTLGRHTQPQMAPYSSALAVENLWLAARAEGLGVGWVSFFDEREMVRALELPEHLEVVAYLCVGYVDEFPPEPELAQAGWSKRRPLSWVVHEESYGRRVLPGAHPHDLLTETLEAIRPLDAKALGEAWERQKRMTKPAGALGMLEIISAQLCGLSRQCPPPIPEPAAVAVFAGDHGVHAQGVTPWSQEVTGQMVANFLDGGAVCNAFATQVGAEVCVVDVGVGTELPSAPGLLPRKVRPGTADMTQGPALSRDEAARAIEVGIETARDLVTAGNRALVTGEMGIANTTASAALICACTGVDPAEATGRGTGINDETHARKVEVVRRALELHQPDAADPVGMLAAFGGLEHAAMVGLILGGASLRTPVLLDGVSAGAAALVARALAPESLAACIAGHRSAEPGHVAALTKLGLRPLVDLDLRLGEGTGALLALPLVQSAARTMHEVATFDSAGVTEKE